MGDTWVRLCRPRQSGVHEFSIKDGVISLSKSCVGGWVYDPAPTVSVSIPPPCMCAGIVPYINASIVLQLLATAFPALTAMQRL